MNEREELRRLIDVIEKSSGGGSLEQAVDDIKTFANTASFLTNKLDTRLKGGEVKAKKKPKSRMGKAIASVPKPNIPKSPSSPPDPSSKIYPACQQRPVLQHHRLTLSVSNLSGRNHPLGQVDRSGACCRMCCGLRALTQSCR